MPTRGENRIVRRVVRFFFSDFFTFIYVPRDTANDFRERRRRPYVSRITMQCSGWTVCRRGRIWSRIAKTRIRAINDECVSLRLHCTGAKPRFTNLRARRQSTATLVFHRLQHATGFNRSVSDCVLNRFARRKLCHERGGRGRHIGDLSE